MPSQPSIPSNFSNDDLLMRLQSILINAAEGRRSVGDDADYPVLRRELSRRTVRSPRFVDLHPTVDSFHAFIRGVPDRAERVLQVRADFADSDMEGGADSSSWTGVQSRVQRLRTVRSIIPLAKSAIEGMILELEQSGPNGGPILNHREEAIEHLKTLHRALGNLLEAIDAGSFDDELGQGLVSEIVRYAKRSAKVLSDDPLPYISASLLLGMFHAAGFPGIGGFLSGIAVKLSRNAGRSTR